MATIKQTKSQTLQLNHAAVEEDFFEDLKMLCIICAHEPYHLAWQINRNIPVTFKRTPDQDIQIGDNYFILYEFEEVQNQICHYLIAARSKTNYILPELKNIDFIWMIKGGRKVDEYIKDLPAMLKPLPGVIDCRYVDHKKLSNRKVFLL